MPLTPADVHNVSFRKPQIGKRGFDAEEVDAFLDKVGSELVRLIEENNELRNRAEYGGEPADLGADSRSAVEIDDLKARLDRALRDKAAVEQQVRAIGAELERARSQGRPLAREGEQVLRVLMMAQRTADEHVTQARREAEALLSEARAEAEELVREARAKARNVELDARKRHEDAVGGLDARRTAAQKDIEELQRFGLAYRTGLKAFLERRLRDCEAGQSDLTPVMN